MTPPAVRALLGGLLGLALLGTTGCSSTSEPTPGRATGRSSATAGTSPAAPSPSSSVSSSPSSSESSPLPSPVLPTTSDVQLTERLLPARSVPGFNDAFAWRTASTATVEPDSLFGTCQRFAMRSIGAQRVAVRHYDPVATDDDSRAGELVAEFPDDVTAHRAYAVLTSWPSRCGDRLASYDPARIGPLRSVPGGYGSGDWYLLTYGPTTGDPDAQHVDAQGLAIHGNRVAMLQLDLVGQDDDHDRGEEPMVAAVHAALLRL